MANMLSRTMMLSTVIESTYNTTPAPETTTFSSQHLLFRNTSVGQVNTNIVDLAELRQSFTKTGIAIGRQLQVFTPGLVLMGHASAASTFRLGRLFRMCGLSESLTGESSATYTFRSSGFESGAVSLFENAVTGNGVLYKATGAYATATIAGSAGQPITVDTTITGIFNAPIEQATPTAPNAITNTAETMKSEGCTITGLTGGNIAAASLKFKQFSLDLGTDVQEDTDANSASGLYGLLIAGRNPTLSLTIGMDSDRATDFYTDLTAATLHTISFTHGSIAGRRCTVTASGKLSNVERADDVGLRTLVLSYTLTANTDEGELTLAFT